MALLTQAALQEALRYDPETGHFFWKKKVADKVVVGSQAGYTPSGPRHRVVIRLYRRLYPAHRLAFLYMTGAIPAFIDHIDGNNKNNAWSNLRATDPTLNLGNTKRRSDNKSGFKGVFFAKQVGKWQARIKAYGKARHLGTFENPEAAHEAYCIAAKELFGEHARFV